MCNIAGYVGTRRAAPILIDMMLKEEGWGGGYYTGLATIHEGKIYYAKLTGDVKDLVNKTDAMNLPGAIGILHSRSKSGGGDEWAHPFIGGKNGQVISAYVANGSYGCFKELNAEKATGVAQRLMDEGYAFSSRVDEQIGSYPALKDGGSAHVSDVMSQLIAEKIDQGQDPASAMTNAFCEMPSEIVGLLLSLQEPENIVFSRINQPMMVAFAEHGAYMATTSLAFPEDAGQVTLLPACSGGRVYKDRVEAKPYDNPPCKVAALDAGVVSEAWQIIEKEISEGPKTVGELCKAIKPVFEEADCVPAAMTAYHVLQGMQDKGILQTVTERVEGSKEGIDAPLFKALAADKQ